MPYRKKSNFRKKRSPARRKKGGVSSSVKTYVKRQISAAVEDKFVMTDLVGATSGNAELILTPSASTLPQYYSCIFSQSQGDGIQARQGSKIKLKRATLQIQMALSGAAITTAVDVPMNIYYFLLHTRDSPDSLNATDLNSLFYYSGGLTQFLSGSGYATTRNINNDYFKVCKTNYPNKPIKLGWSQYSSGGLSSNNDYRSNFHFKIDYTRYCEKIVKFNSGNTTPVNHNFYLCFYVQKQNLDVTTANWDAPVAYVTQCVHYEDA